jgi:hypothetical protein
MTTNDNELAKQKHSSLYQEVPEFLRGTIGNQAGMEDVDSSDILLPRLGLCQSLSPQRRKSDSAYIPGLEEGQLFNTVTQEIYGIDLVVIALFFFKNRIKYIDIDEGGGIDCISVNAIDGGRLSPASCASCQFSSWGNGALKESESANDPPLCTLYHNFMAFMPDVEIPSPIAVSYKSTGLKLSKQLLAAVRLTNMPMFSKYYRVTVVEMKKDKNQWFEKKITPDKYVNRELFDQMDHLFKKLKASNIKIDTTGEEAEVEFGHGANDIEGQHQAF